MLKKTENKQQYNLVILNFIHMEVSFVKTLTQV